jgi:hypothetical protein
MLCAEAFFLAIAIKLHLHRALPKNIPAIIQKDGIITISRPVHADLIALSGEGWNGSLVRGRIDTTDPAHPVFVPTSGPDVALQPHTPTSYSDPKTADFYVPQLAGTVLHYLHYTRRHQLALDAKTPAP